MTEGEFWELAGEAIEETLRQPHWRAQLIPARDLATDAVLAVRELAKRLGVDLGSQLAAITLPR